MKIEGDELKLTFIDLRVAFDAVNKTSIWNCLRGLEVPFELVINIIYVMRFLFNY